MQFPGSVEAVHFMSGDITLVGSYFVAAGNGPHPTVVLLHGLPGAEKNTDIAYRLRNLGWNSLIVHFRGAWGSGGQSDLSKHPDDAIAAVDYVLSSPWPADPQRIVVIGYSFGGRAALVAAHRDARIGAVITLAAIADFDDLMMSDSFFTNCSHFLRGATRQSLSKEWLSLGGDDNPITLIGRIRQPVLVIQGTADEVVPYFMATGLHSAARPTATLIPVEGADHSFTHHREKLVDIVTGWLQGWASIER